MEKENKFNFVFAKIKKIIPPDEINKKCAVYIIEMWEENNENNKWIKQYTLNELENFRNYIIK